MSPLALLAHRRLIGQLQDVAAKLRSPGLRPSGYVVLMARADRMLDQLLDLEPRLRWLGPI